MLKWQYLVMQLQIIKKRHFYSLEQFTDYRLQLPVYNSDHMLPQIIFITGII